jgi:hypothetical protein
LTQVDPSSAVKKQQLRERETFCYEMGNSKSSLNEEISTETGCKLRWKLEQL